MDSIYLSYGADEKVYGLGENDIVRSLRQRVIQNNLRLVESPIRHIGTEKCRDLYMITERLKQRRRDSSEPGQDITVDRRVAGPARSTGPERGALAGRTAQDGWAR